MRIAICEDNKSHAEILQEMVIHWAQQEHLDVEIKTYVSAEQFLFLMKDEPHYDLAFLDIELGTMTGLELARFIRKDDPTIFLVFTTGQRRYAVKGYEVSAFRYLLKPLSEKDVISTLSKANQLLQKKKNDVAIIPWEGGLRRIDKDDIYYIEVDNHHIILHTKSEIIRFKEKMKDFSAQFSEPQFCKCHRSYIVNLLYVTTLTRAGVELESGDILAISRARWDDLNRCYLSYYTKR